MGVAQKKKKLSAQGKRSLFLWFFLAALFLSLAVHAVFLEKAATWKVSGFSPEGYDEIVPRTFRMKRVEIDPRTLEEPSPTPSRKKEPMPVVIEKETPQILSQQAEATKSPVLANPPEAQLQEKPVVNEEALDDLVKKTAPANAASESHLPAAMDRDIPLADEGGKNITERGTTIAGVKEPKFSSLDDLLAGGTPVSPTTAPILMPTDLLFEYDSSTLKPEAAASLAKLGTLIALNSGSTFRIEGHTDSFGSDAYNMELSLRRAEEVKAWLQKNMGIPPERITTAGFGKTRLLVPGTRNISEQQLNRRVEIVITTAQP